MSDPHFLTDVCLFSGLHYTATMIPDPKLFRAYFEDSQGLKEYAIKPATHVDGVAPETSSDPYRPE